MGGADMGCGGGRVRRAGRPAFVSTERCEACALFRGLKIRPVEVGGALTFLGSRWGSEERAGHTHPVPSARRPGPPPAAMCRPGEGAGLPSGGLAGRSVSPESPAGSLCVCVCAARTRVGSPLCSAPPSLPGLLPSPGRGHLVTKALKSLVSALGFVVHSGRLSPRGGSRDHARGFSALGCPLPGGLLAASLDSTHQGGSRNVPCVAWCPSRGRVAWAEIRYSGGGSWVSQRALRPASVNPEAELRG